MSEISPNEQFEDVLRDKLFKARDVFDKYSVAVMLLSAVLKQLPPEKQQNVLNSLLTEYVDLEHVDRVKYMPSYFEACKSYLGYQSSVARNLKYYEDLVMIPFQRKREVAMVEILKESDRGRDESSLLRRLLGQRDQD